MIKNKDTLKQAIINTSKSRNNLNYINNAKEYIDLISQDERLQTLWANYQNNYSYASSISFEETIKAIKLISEVIS